MRKLFVFLMSPGIPHFTNDNVFYPQSFISKIINLYEPVTMFDLNFQKNAF